VCVCEATGAPTMLRLIRRTVALASLEKKEGMPKRHNQVSSESMVKQTHIGGISAENMVCAWRSPPDAVESRAEWCVCVS